MPRRASKRRISSLPSATLDQSSLRSRSSRKILARSQSSKLVASRAIRSSRALRSRCEFILCEMARMAAKLSFNSGCGSELIGSLSLLYRVACVHKVDRAYTRWTRSDDAVRENSACVADNKRFTCQPRYGDLRALPSGCGGAIRRRRQGRRHRGGSPWPWYGALTASALEPTNGGERRAKGSLCQLQARSGNHTSCASGIPGAQAHPRSEIWQFRLWPESARTSIEFPAVGPAIWASGPPPMPPKAGLTSAQAKARALPFRAPATRRFAA